MAGTTGTKSKSFTITVDLALSELFESMFSDERDALDQDASAEKLLSEVYDELERRWPNATLVMDISPLGYIDANVSFGNDSNDSNDSKAELVKQREEVEAAVLQVIYGVDDGGSWKVGRRRRKRTTAKRSRGKPHDPEV
jgi:hypothetical protein